MNQWKCIIILCNLVIFSALIKESVTFLLSRKLSKCFDDYWFKYKSMRNKTYVGILEMKRRIAWESNLFKIYEHNLLATAGHYSYLLRDNCIADLSTGQYLREWVKLIPSNQLLLDDDPMVQAVLHDPNRVPEYLDWRTCGFLTPPEEQLDCGSCYAYAIIGTIIGQLYRLTGHVYSLSKQQIVDCSSSTGNLGCDGGSLRNTLKYLEQVRGLMGESYYPYIGRKGTCKFQENLSVINITSWAILPARDERALEAAVATIGPIAVSVNASPKTFQLYHRGVYDDPSCSASDVNHAMLVVGYSPTYWILKNWWGSNWGENGYMRLAKNKNRCGIANYAGYARI
ncbi:procathepsin L-like [Leptopilina heterotoma]|uniref:procathepsin L-like n=1 Tax=Leptopilina heterotoma TaxID=63436 RepID=UPI001CA8B272|nr:procathepsin L-like [Leptopilina heterotoma]